MFTDIFMKLEQGNVRGWVEGGGGGGGVIGRGDYSGDGQNPSLNMLVINSVP